jgi:hypothetical protein
LRRGPRISRAKFPNTELIAGNWENKFDLNSNGTIDADHERVKRMGEAKAKNDNKEKVSVDFTGGNGLTHDSEVEGEDSSCSAAPGKLTDRKMVTESACWPKSARLPESSCCGGKRCGYYSESPG